MLLHISRKLSFAKVLAIRKECFNERKESSVFLSEMEIGFLGHILTSQQELIHLK